MNFNSAPPDGWDRETPRYKATRAVHPSPNPRHRHERPFAYSSDGDCHQFGERDIAAGEEIETKAWPHPSFRPLNYSASMVLDFFNTRQKSRMPLSPWRNGRIELEDGLTFATEPNLPLKTGAAA